MCSILSDESFLNMERLSLPVICPAQLRPSTVEQIMDLSRVRR